MPKPRILVTRPAHQAAGQATLLESLGAEPVLLPLLEIKPVTESDSGFNLLKSRVMDLDLYQKVIFISGNAVTYGIDLIDQYWPQLPGRHRMVGDWPSNRGPIRQHRHHSHSVSGRLRL